MSELKAERLAYRQLRWLIADLKLELMLRRLGRKYRANQPRDDRGRWIGHGPMDISALVGVGRALYWRPDVLLSTLSTLLCVRGRDRKLATRKLRCVTPIA